MRRLGGLLATPPTCRRALQHHELVLVLAEGTDHAHAGKVPHDWRRPRRRGRVPVFPVATMSSAVGAAGARSARRCAPAASARGPLAEGELAEQVQHHLQRMLDGFGGMQTGVAPLDWLAEG